MQKQQIPLKNSLILLLAAIIWGIAFVAQSVGMDYVGGFTFNAARSLIGSAVLVPLILVLVQKNSGSVSSHSTTSGQQSRKDLIIGGISCESKAGYKHHLSTAYLAHLKQDVMDMCQKEGLGISEIYEAFE